MKILCQERYDKAVAYAKEIKNDTLQKCIDSLIRIPTGISRW